MSQYQIPIDAKTDLGTKNVSLNFNHKNLDS